MALNQNTQLRGQSSRFSQVALVQDLRTWAQDETTDWDELVSGESSNLPGGSDLWDDMPEIDSKTVARSSSIFETHLGIPLNVNLIQPGGYTDIDEMIEHLVPAMIKLKKDGRLPRKQKVLEKAK